MTNIISLEEGLKLRLQKHLDLAEVWLETGDRVAYEYNINYLSCGVHILLVD